MKTLICFPSSGSSSSLFAPWKLFFEQKNIALICPEYPARGRRFNDPPTKSIDALAQDMMHQLQDELKNNEDYHLFGHSLGGIVAYELALKIQQSPYKAPKSVFISSSHAPHKREKTSLKSHLSDSELIAALKQIGGLKQEVLNHPELLELVLPIIRADLALNEHYQISKKVPLSCPIITIHGTDDPVVKLEYIKEWKHYSEDYQHINWPGDHFYFQPDLERFLTALATSLEAVYKRD
jgi:surfactin synthase thioesterase subunit